MMNMIKPKHRRALQYFFIGITIVLVLGVAGWDHATAAKQYVMKIGHATANDAQDATAKFFAKEVERLTGGRIKAPVYNASQLGNNFKMNKDVRIGAQECIVQPTGFAVPYIHNLAVLDLPFLFTDDEAYLKVINSEATDSLRKSAQKAGVEIVSFIQTSVKSFYTTFPLKTFEDFKGRKFRVIQSPVLIKQIEAYGAVAVPMPLGELYTGLQQGVVEGFQNPPDLAVRMKFHEVAKYATLTKHGTNALFIAVNKRWFDALPKDLQDSVRKAAVNASVEGMKIQRKSEAKAYDELKTKANFSVFPESEMAKLREAAKPVWDEIRKDPVKAELLGALLHGMGMAK